MFRTTRCEVPGLGEVLGDVRHGEVRGPGTVVGVGRIRTVESEGHVPHGEVRGSGMEGDRVEFRTGRCEVQAPQKVSGGSEHRTPKGIWVVGRCGTVHPKGTGWLVSASEGFRTWMCEVPTPREVWRKEFRDRGMVDWYVIGTGHQQKMEK